MSNTIKVDIETVKAEFPNSEWPCYRYCKKLIAEGIDKNSRLEVWNYSYEKPEADWVVPNIDLYVKNCYLAKGDKDKVEDTTLEGPAQTVEGTSGALFVAKGT